MRRGETRRVRRIKNCWLTWRMSTFFRFVFFPFPLLGTKVLFLVLVNFFCFFGYFFCFFGKHNCRRNISYTTYCVCDGVCVYVSVVCACMCLSSFGSKRSYQLQPSVMNSSLLLLLLPQLLLVLL